MPNKGINLPDTELAIPAVTPRDRAALALAASASVDWLGLSFVRSADDAKELRDVARTFGLRLPILAKIERPEAVEHAQAIIDAFDGIMVARGDLGVEIDLENVPHVQKRLINLARAAAKPVITATDMLDSMRVNPRPTRAEASDVANAVYDGTGAVMLSGETAAGQYPVEAFQMMDRIVREAEAHFHWSGFSGQNGGPKGVDAVPPRSPVVSMPLAAHCYPNAHKIDSVEQGSDYDRCHRKEPNQMVHSWDNRFSKRLLRRVGFAGAGAGTCAGGPGSCPSREVPLGSAAPANGGKATAWPGHP